MLKVQIRTLSLLYDPREDRMKLVINKDKEEEIDFWITRRFYFSLLFELETMLEALHITPFPLNGDAQNSRPPSKKTQTDPLKSEQNKKMHRIDMPPAKSRQESSLLENINIRFSPKRKEFFFLFQSNEIEAQSILAQEQFLHFYNILKKTFPKGEWGLM